jgi:RNA-directed DNA polymerase
MSFKSDLTVLKRREQLILFLELDEQTFEDVVTFDPKAKALSEESDDQFSPGCFPHFLRHEIPKKNRRRGYRIVWEPTTLKNQYKALARRLTNFFEHSLAGFPHTRTFGYIGGRNIRENARDHCGHKHLTSVDLKDFFPSIKAPAIATFLKSTGIEPAIADLLSRFVTIQGALPLGLPTSPTIANAICLPMDFELDALAKKYDATYSRYADDISFSTDGILPSKDVLAACVLQHGFEIAESKTRTSKLGQAHYVTGLSVSDPVQPHVPRKKKRRLRQEIHYAGKYGLSDHFRHAGVNDPHIVQQEINRLDGLVKFTAYHEPRLSTSLKTQWTKILQSSGDGPSFRPKNQHRTPFYIYVDEAEYVRHGECVLALAMAASQHQEQLDHATQEVLDAACSDMYAAGNRSAILKRGMHYSDATEDVRFAYISRMQSLPFEGYVSMARLPSPAEYEATYLRLLNAMIKRRLMAAESKLANLVFEKNNKVSQDLVRQAVMEAYNSLCDADNRHPEEICVQFTGKPNLGMSVPDFLLGVLGNYLSPRLDQRGKPLERDKLLFERVRDKYRLILDLDERTEYSRRRSIVPWNTGLQT